MEKIKELEEQLMNELYREIVNFVKSQPKQRFYLGYDDCVLPYESCDETCEIVALKVNENEELMIFIDSFNESFTEEDVFSETNEDSCLWETLDGNVADINVSFVDRITVLRAIYDALSYDMYMKKPVKEKPVTHPDRSLKEIEIIL